MSATIRIDLTPAQLQAVLAVVCVAVSDAERLGERPDRSPLGQAEFALDSALLSWEQREEVGA